MAMLTSRQMTVSKTLCFRYVHLLLFLSCCKLRVQGADARDRGFWFGGGRGR